MIAPKVSRKRKASGPAPLDPHVARAKVPLKFSHTAFSGKSMLSGTSADAPRFHSFSNIAFPVSKTLSDGAVRLAPSLVADYRADTGLTPLFSTQDWGAVPSPSKKTNTMYRSRRGSIVGLSNMPDGSVKGWRLHSLPTTEALRDASASKPFVSAFDESAKRLYTPALNSKGTEQTINTVLSDVGKVRYDHGTARFAWIDGSYAMGVSAKGLDKTASGAPSTLYAPSVKSAKRRGKKSNPAQNHHSEPMAVTLHDTHRHTPMAQDTGLVATFASFPNQVCFHCGEMFKDNLGSHSALTGVPGRPFGGQHPGETTTKSGSSIVRAHPMTELVADKGHHAELAKIFSYHKP
ncbi:hypothetical protein [Luteibacter sp. 9135]|uniref:hypothetical protein n=1 Tax=Luteibacter sp. 9135 TaxID=1500893 RepID=UPI00055AA1C8|nr:hypothetical protein [Luteibacter sp. 9135]